MTSHLWQLIQDCMDEETRRYRMIVRQADIARRSGVSEAVLSGWRKTTPTVGARLPEPRLLAAVAHAIGRRYEDLLDAALEDRGYLPEPSQTVSPSGDTDGSRRPYSAAVSEAVAKVPPRSRRRAPAKK